MTTQTNNLNIGDKVTFFNHLTFNNNHKTGTIIETNITNVDGVPLDAHDMPCHVVLTEDDCTWAVPVEWMI